MQTRRCEVTDRAESFDSGIGSPAYAKSDRRRPLYFRAEKLPVHKPTNVKFMECNTALHHDKKCNNFLHTRMHARARTVPCCEPRGTHSCGGLIACEEPGATLKDDMQ